MVFGKALRTYILNCQMRWNYPISPSRTYRQENVVIGDLVIVLAVGAADVHDRYIPWNESAYHSCGQVDGQMDGQLVQRSEDGWG